MVLEAAHKHGWEPMGTILYRHAGIHPDMISVELEEMNGLRIVVESTVGDRALGFEQATKTREPIPEWCGTYFSNSGQLIRAQDAVNLVKGIKSAIDADEFTEDWLDHIRELISVLEAGECRIL